MNFLIQKLPWNRVDKGLLIALFGLMTFGLLFVYSATYNNELFSSSTLIKQPYFKQGIFYLAGLTTAFVLCLKDYNQIARWAYVFYWLYHHADTRLDSWHWLHSLWSPKMVRYWLYSSTFRNGQSRFCLCWCRPEGNI